MRMLAGLGAAGRDAGNSAKRGAGDVAKRAAGPEALRGGLVIVAAAWMSGYLRNPGRWTLLDDVDLAIHEAGHVVFSPFGEFMAVAGGSLFQVLVPLAFVAYFAWRRDAFAASVVLFWVSQSLFNVAVYIADARAQALPLVGGEYAIHDWSWMLSRLMLLRRDEAIADGVRMVASVLWAGAALGGLLFARKRVAAPDVS